MYQRSAQGFLKHLDFILLDLACLHVSFLLSYMVRHGIRNPYRENSYFAILVFLTLACLLISIFFNTFKNVLKRGCYGEFTATARQVCLVVLLASFYLFTIQGGFDISRIVIYLTGINYAAFSYMARLVWKRHLRKKLKGKNKKSLLIVTTCDRMHEMIERMQKSSFDAYRIAGVIAVGMEHAVEAQKEAYFAKQESFPQGIPMLSPNRDTLEKLCMEWVDEAFIDICPKEAYPEALIKQLMEMGVVVHISLEGILEPMGQKQSVERLSGCTVLTSSINMATTGQSFLKRFIDICAGIVGCAVTLVLMIILGPIICLHSPGPVFFTQIRVGRNGRRFKMYKFRSMYPDAEERKRELLNKNRVSDGRMFKLDYDPRIIGCKKLPDGRIKKGIGNFIRDWSLDEFPQFFNVLKGDMSLVGTRPPTVDEWEKYDLHHRVRLAVKPGITGLWQVSGRSGITDFEEVVKLDLEYITGWNLGMDVKIVLRTVGAVVGKKGAM